MTTKTYLSVADTAKLVRKALKEKFPGQKFSVRSSSYAGGASIDVGWIDGPTDKAVSAVTSAYTGADFDGMIDMAIYTESWYCPEHGATFKATPGTEGSMGTIPEAEGAPPCLEAVPVSMGADYIHTNRRYSEEAVAAALVEINEAAGPGIDLDTHCPEVDVWDGKVVRTTGNGLRCWVTGYNLVHQLLGGRVL